MQNREYSQNTNVDFSYLMELMQHNRGNLSQAIETLRSQDKKKYLFFLVNMQANDAEDTIIQISNHLSGLVEEGRLEITSDDNAVELLKRSALFAVDDFNPLTVENILGEAQERLRGAKGQLNTVHIGTIDASPTQTFTLGEINRMSGIHTQLVADKRHFS